MIKLKTKIIFIAVCVVILGTIIVGWIIQNDKKIRAHSEGILRVLERTYSISLPEDVRCKRLWNSTLTEFACYDVKDSSFVWTNDQGIVVPLPKNQGKNIDYTLFHNIFDYHFGSFMVGTRPELDKIYYYYYNEVEFSCPSMEGVYIMYFPENNELFLDTHID